MRTMFIGMCVYIAGRVRTVGPEASDYISVERSILQGCMQGVAWTRTYLHMHANAHARFWPVELSTR
eukprot:8446347-Pyramimonas_sp.AAC.1